jgi:hypothetical protein
MARKVTPARKLTATRWQESTIGNALQQYPVTIRW